MLTPSSARPDPCLIPSPRIIQTQKNIFSLWFSLILFKSSHFYIFSFLFYWQNLERFMHLEDVIGQHVTV